ncbi:MAG: hypothetical protein PHQ04_09730 [Opitutaceae bacterium]|nr:hypothetical protein [Opitutaceae bacterium]
MAISKKVDRALYGPGMLEVALGAILGFALGLMLAFLFLAFKPVQVVKEVPKEPAKGMVYYQEGSKDSSKSRSLLVKRQRFVEGSTVAFTEDELNAWVATWSSPPTATSPAPAAKPGEPPAPAATSQGLFVPSTPNFRIHDGKLQVGMKCKVNLAALGFTQDVIVQADGGFKKEGDRFVFAPDAVYLGSCPVQRLVGVAGPLVSRLSALFPVPDDIKTAWGKLTDVAVDGSALKLTAP